MKKAVLCLSQWAAAVKHNEKADTAVAKFLYTRDSTLQVLRWHQGAVQLLFYKGLFFTSFGGRFPTIWHRIYAFDQATYYLQVRCQSRLRD